MIKKVVLFGLIVWIMVSWPISLIRNRPNFRTQLIFYKSESEEIQRIYKLGLSTSPVKHVFYNKTSTFINRYIKNFFVLIDPSNYFFEMHPREDVVNVDYRFKYPFFTIIFALFSIYYSIIKNKNKLIWIGFLLLTALLSLIDRPDGWDFILYFPITYLIIFGLIKVINYEKN